MRIHHLSCGTMCPIPAALFYRKEAPAEARQLACHCLLIETDRHGLVLVDTGLGMPDLVGDAPRIPFFFRLLNRPRLGEEQRAVNQVKARGFAPQDVQHILLTHLDFDHAGGIEDFPWATVHVLRREYEAAQERRGFIGERRYRPMQWNAGVKWQLYAQADGEPWFHFAAVRQLAGLPPELLMIPLRGHTLGHAGVAVATPAGWVLHAGDAYFDAREMRPEHAECAIGRRLYQRMMEADRKARLYNQERLRALLRHHGEDLQIFCSHDPEEFLAASALPAAANEPSRLARQA
jgi:glyoxylase-like metal-dependent hydrolase (beta-lactamase superfamily II)